MHRYKNKVDYFHKMLVSNSIFKLGLSWEEAELWTNQEFRFSLVTFVFARVDNKGGITGASDLYWIKTSNNLRSH